MATNKPPEIYVPAGSPIIVPAGIREEVTGSSGTEETTEKPSPKTKAGKKKALSNAKKSRAAKKRASQEEERSGSGEQGVRRGSAAAQTNDGSGSGDERTRSGSDGLSGSVLPERQRPVIVNQSTGPDVVRSEGRRSPRYTPENKLPPSLFKRRKGMPLRKQTSGSESEEAPPEEVSGIETSGSGEPSSPPKKPDKPIRRSEEDDSSGSEFGKDRPEPAPKPWLKRPAAPRAKAPAQYADLYDGNAREELPGGVEVPPEIFALAEEASSHWDMSVSNWTLAASKPEKGWGAIWKIETNRGPRSLKLLHRAVPRSLFSVAAQEYLVSQGARVPALIRTTGDVPYTVVGDRMFIVTEWVEGLTPAPNDVTGAAALSYGLGEFQMKSRGYVPPKEAYYATRLHRWPKTYRKLRSKLDWFIELARAYPEMPASPVLLENIGLFIEQADNAIDQLENRSAYNSLTSRGEQAWGLVHQDYGWSNGQLGPGGVWVIDLDGVAFDLGVRDLRKLITGTMDDRGDWDVPFMQAMIQAYNESCPIEPELLQVMLTDMSLPNEFYKLVKEIVFDPTTLNETMAASIVRCVEAQPRKEEALAALGWERR